MSKTINFLKEDIPFQWFPLILLFISVCVYTGYAPLPDPVETATSPKELIGSKNSLSTSTVCYSKASVKLHSKKLLHTFTSLQNRLISFNRLTQVKFNWLTKDFCVVLNTLPFLLLKLPIRTIDIVPIF